MKKEPRAKRAKAQRPVQREPKEVLAELVEKLQGKLAVKATSASQAEAGARGELSPNLDRLTVGIWETNGATSAFWVLKGRR